MMADELDDLEGGGDQPPGVGHNSGEADAGSGVEGIAVNELRHFIKRIERLEAEKKELALDIREVYAEAKGRGFDTKAMRAAVRARAMDAAKREEERAVTEMYFHALGLM